MNMKYYKTIITIYSDYEPNRDIENLARDAINGAAYCSGQETFKVTKEEIEGETGENFFYDYNEEKEGDLI